MFDDIVGEYKQIYKGPADDNAEYNRHLYLLLSKKLHPTTTKIAISILALLRNVDSHLSPYPRL
jgi:hypothetical protein